MDGMISQGVCFSRGGWFTFRIDHMGRVCHRGAFQQRSWVDMVRGRRVTGVHFGRGVGWLSRVDGSQGEFGFRGGWWLSRG
jgi:hypothetical protein